MAQRPNLDIATALAPLLTPPFTLNTDIFAGPVRPFLQTTASGVIVPRVAIFTNVLTSALPTRLFRGIRIQNPNVQVYIRHNDFDVGELLAIDVHKQTEDMEVSAGALAAYISVIGLDSAPNMLGRDDQENHQWTVNLEVKYVRTP